MTAQKTGAKETTDAFARKQSVEKHYYKLTYCAVARACTIEYRTDVC